jgi:hypothetical protein
MPLGMRRSAGERRLHVLRGRVDITVERELERDVGGTRPEDDVIASMPAIVDSCRSSGVATADAIVSGLAPGRLALIEMVG